jgi:DNA polymerase/3'-5' exonuclease PolX
MANNLSVTAGTGTTVATDQGPSGEHYQLVKIVDSTEDSTTRTGIAGNPIQVSIANTGANTNKVLVTPDLPTGASTAAKQPALGTAGTASSDVLSIQGIASMTPLQVADNGGALTVDGTVTANLSSTDNTVLDNIDSNTSSIKTAVETLDNAISGSEMQVDVVGALPAGTALLGKVGIDQATANANEVVVKSGTVTAVTAISNALPAGTNLLGKVSIDQTTANANEVVTKTGSVTTATLSAETTKVIGTVNVSASQSIEATQATAADLNMTEANSGAIKTAVEVIDNAISGTEMQVDVVGALPAGTALLGKVGIDQSTANANEVVVKSGTVTAVTSLTNALPAGDNNIGNVDIASALPTGTNTIGSVKITDGSETVAVNASNQMEVEVKNSSLTVSGTGTMRSSSDTTDSIRSYQQTDSLYYDTSKLEVKYAIIDHAGSGDNTIVSAVANKKIRVLNVMLVASAALTARFESGAGGTALTGQMSLAANSGFSSGYSPVGHFQTASGALLNLELSAASSVDGWIVYVEV